MNLSALHKRLLQDVLDIGNAFPLVITGGYAVQAHGLVDRLSRDIDVATNSPAPMPSLAAHLVAALAERGWQVRVIGVDPISARFMVTDPGTGEDCEVDVLKEGFNRPPEATPYGPVLALEDVIGTKVRALADRGYPRDLVDIHAASRLRSQSELERLGRRCAWDEFSLEGLAVRLNSVQWRADEEFSAYGLNGDEIADLRRWAQAWAEDINRRLYAETYADDEDDAGPLTAVPWQPSPTYGGRPGRTPPAAEAEREQVAGEVRDIVARSAGTVGNPVYNRCSAPWCPSAAPSWTASCPCGGSGSVPAPSSAPSPPAPVTRGLWSTPWGAATAAAGGGKASSTNSASDNHAARTPASLRSSP